MTEQLAQYPNQSPFPPAPNDEIDLRLLARALWRGRWWIVGITLFGALVGAGISLWSTKYQSRGLFLTPGVSIGDYKTYSAALNNLPRWQRFAKTIGSKDTEIVELIDKTIASPDPSDFARMVSPVFTFTDNEAKQFGVKLDESKVGLVGVQLTLSPSRISNPAPIDLLAEYLRSVIITTDLQFVIQQHCVDNQTKVLSLSNARIDNDFAISQNRSRRAVLGEIMQKLPESARSDGQQIINVQQGGERFLSPLTQRVGVDVAISDLQLDNTEKQRDLIAATLKTSYYCQSRDALDGSITGPAFLLKLAAIQKSVFADEDMKSDVVQKTANELTVELDNWNNRYLRQMRFVTTPEGAQILVRKPDIILAVALGIVLGGIFGLFIVLLAGWCHDNWQIISATTE